MKFRASYISKILYILPLFFLLNVTLLNAQDPKPIILTIPVEWQYEKIDFPLDFAPTIDYEGFEELRFSPGMFKPKKKDYFTYFFVMSIGNKSTISKAEMQEMLLQYYTGLAQDVAKEKGEDIDTSKITSAVLEMLNLDGSNLMYMASIHFIDAFTDNRLVRLNMEIELMKDTENGNLVVFAMVSPQNSQSKVWKSLMKMKSEILNQNPQLL